MTTPTLSEMFSRLGKAEVQTRAARTVEYFGWLDLVLGLSILVAPRWAAALLHLPPLGVQDANYLHMVGTLVSTLGMLYTVSGRLNSEGFVVASLLDRPLVPVIMAVLWSMHILPGPLAVAFSISDFGGFLWTFSAWRADTRQGLNSGGPELREQPRAARVVGSPRVARHRCGFRYSSGALLGRVVAPSPLGRSARAQLFPARRPAGRRTGNAVPGEREPERSGRRLRVFARPSHRRNDPCRAVVGRYPTASSGDCLFGIRVWRIFLDAVGVASGRS